MTKKINFPCQLQNYLLRQKQLPLQILCILPAVHSKVKFVLLRSVTLDHSHTNMDELLYLLPVIFWDSKILEPYNIGSYNWDWWWRAQTILAHCSYAMPMVKFVWGNWKKHFSKLIKVSMYNPNINWKP